MMNDEKSDSTAIGIRNVGSQIAMCKKGFRTDLKRRTERLQQASLLLMMLAQSMQFACMPDRIHFTIVQ